MSDKDRAMYPMSDDELRAAQIKRNIVQWVIRRTPIEGQRSSSGVRDNEMSALDLIEWHKRYGGK